MKILAIILIALLMAGGVLADEAADEASADILITSLPTTISQSSHPDYPSTPSSWGIARIQGSSLDCTSSTSFSRALSLGSSANHWIIEGDDDTIRFDVNAVMWDSTRGLGFNNNYCIIIRNLTIEHAPSGWEDSTESTFEGDSAATDRGISGHRVFDWGNADSVIFENCTFVIRGYDGAWSNSSGGFPRSAGFLFRHCTLKQWGKGHTLRDLFRSAGFMVEWMVQYPCKAEWRWTPNSGADFDYIARFDTCTFEGYSHALIYFSGWGPEDAFYIKDGAYSLTDPGSADTLMTNAITYGRVQFQGCQFYQDNRQWRFPNDVVASALGYSRASEAALFLSDMGPGTSVLGCRFTTGNTWRGGRGIQLEEMLGHPDTPVVFRHDTVISKSGRDPYYSAAWSTPAWKDRYNTRGVTVDSCYFESIASAYSSSDSSVNDRVNAVVREQYNANCGGTLSTNFWSEFADSSVGNSWSTWTNNTIVGTKATLNCIAMALCYTGDWCLDPTAVWRNNRIITGDIGYALGGYDGNSSNKDYIESDTIVFVDTIWDGTGIPIDSFATISRQPGNDYQVQDEEGFVFTDLHFENCDDCDTLITPLSLGANQFEVMLRYTPTIVVVDSQGAPVEGAVVVASDSTGTEVWRDTTDAQGSAGKTLDWFERLESSRTWWRYHEFLAFLDGDSATDTLAIRHNTVLDTIQLTETQSPAQPEGPVRYFKGVKRP